MYASKTSVGVLALFYCLMIWDIKISDATPIPEEQKQQKLPEQTNSHSSIDCKLSTESEAKYALHNATLVYEKLNSIYNALQKVPNDFYVKVLVDGIIPFDIELIFELHNYQYCEEVQQVLNTSIFYLQCFGDHIGDILINVTKKDVYSNASNINSTLRDAVYEAYGNVTVSRDMMQLVKTFPCQQSVVGEDECHSYEDIKIYSHDGVPIDDPEKKQIGILTRIKDVFYKLKTYKVKHYIDFCVKPVLTD